MIQQTGQCLCGAVKYEVTKPPRKVMVCHCRFCQRATGGAYMVDALFEATDFQLTAGEPAQYTHISQTSGKDITIYFCRICGTKTHLCLEILPDVIGVYAGTFETPDWFDRAPESVTHIFAASAVHGTVLPAGAAVFERGPTDSKGNRLKPQMQKDHHIIKA